MTHDLNELVRRIEKLEKAIFAAPSSTSPRTIGKTRTLPEIVKGKKLNGQQKVAAIVGYLEKILGTEEITANAINEGWGSAKFDGGFANIYITRAAKDALVADYKKDGKYVLTQTGEDFWQSLAG